MTKRKKVKVELIDYSYNCADGCCSNYGTITKVNGKEMDLQNQDVQVILEMVLTELGYNAEVTQSYDYN